MSGVIKMQLETRSSSLLKRPFFKRHASTLIFKAPFFAETYLPKVFYPALMLASLLAFSDLTCATTLIAQQSGANQTDPLGNPVGGSSKAEESQRQKKVQVDEIIPAKTKQGEEPKKTIQDALPIRSGVGNSGNAVGGLPESTLPTTQSLRDFQPGTAAPVKMPNIHDLRRGGQVTKAMAADETSNTSPNPSQSQEARTPQDPAQLILTQAAEGKIKDVEHGAFRLIQRSSTTWEFGLEITAGAGGPVIGAVASAPVPIQWPEQQIKIITQFKSPSVKSVKVKDFKEQGRQMIVSIPQLNAGETAKASVTMTLDRYDITSPKQRPELTFPEKNNREARLYLGESPYIEMKHRRIKELAASIGNDSDTPWKQVEAIYDWVQQNIKYEFDPNIHTCLEALDAKKGDCEEVASLFIAICRAKGIPARAVWCNDHTYPEFMLCTTDGKNVWLPCQITTFEHIFGQMYDDRPILQKGDKFSILGEAAPYRYLKPAMTAKSAVGSPQFRWIIQEVEAGKVIDSADSPLGK